MSTIEFVAVPKPKEGEESPSRAERRCRWWGPTSCERLRASTREAWALRGTSPKTVAYVVQMVETTPDAKELESLFLSAADPRQLGIIGSIDRRDAFREWMKSLETEAGLEWHQ